MKIFNKNNLLQRVDDAIIELNDIRSAISRTLSNPMSLADAAYNQGHRLYLLDKTKGGKPPHADCYVTKEGDVYTVEGGEEGSREAIAAFIKKYMKVEDGVYWVIPLEPDAEYQNESNRMPDDKVSKVEDEYEPISIVDNSTLIYPVDHSVVKSIEPFAVVSINDQSVNCTVSSELNDDVMADVIGYVIDSQKENLLAHLQESKEYGIYVTDKDKFARYTSKLIDVDLGGRGKVVTSPSSRYTTIAVTTTNSGVKFRVDDKKLVSLFGRGKPVFAIKQKITSILEKDRTKTSKMKYFVVDK
tara:strand:- start:3642 stop:4544 length:903 start_codon:yes stop_codon:yes gene_type:complete